MESIDYVTERVWEWGERQTYNPTNYKEKKRKKRGKKEWLVVRV